MNTLGRRALAFSFLLAAALGAQPYRDANRSTDERVRDLVGRMTLEEKFWQLYMTPVGALDSPRDFPDGVFGVQSRAATDARADAVRYNAWQRHFVDSTRLGIPMIAFEEAVHGLMRHGGIVYPAAIGLAASFDSSLVRDVANAIANETRARGVRQVLSPVVNLATDVRWGRVEETYGEDPHLVSVMAREFTGAFHSRGIIATPKHFVANVGDGGRDSYPIDLSRRALEELHFPPFRAAIEAGAGSLMTAYNSVDGLPAGESTALLSGVLRGELGFRGFVISDQSAIGGSVVLHHTDSSTASATARALRAGLDVIFQSSRAEAAPYRRAFQSGDVPLSIVDSAVARVLRAKFDLGLFEHPFVDVDSAALLDHDTAPRLLARRAAQESLVLLRNERRALPLTGAPTLAVLGTDAADARLGGYTLDGAPATSILDALRARIGDRVRFQPGPGRAAEHFTVVPAQAFDSLEGAYFDNVTLEGQPRVTRRDAAIDFRWTFNAPARSVPGDWYSVRWTGRVRTPPAGVRRIGVDGTDGYRLYVDGRLLMDNWRKQSSRTTLAPVDFAPESRHDIRLEFFEGSGNARVRLVWDAGVVDAADALDSAMALARRSDITVVVAGIEEGEFRDRASLALPGRQEELILGAARVGKPVIVILVGGSAITMSRWIDSVDAVLLAWYPGQEGGHAIADALLGDASPSGRLPVTFPLAEGQLPLTYNHKPTGRGDWYVDLTGDPAFPFGFGLSYTTFAYDDLRITPATIPDTGFATITFRVRNTGTHDADEVPQLYVRDVLASVARPVLELKGFTRVHLAPGEERAVTFRLRARDLRFLDEHMRWVVEPGMIRILVGASSRDIRLRGALEVRP